MSSDTHTFPIADREQYDELVGLTQSRLKEFADCPETYWRRHVAKKLPPRADSAAMQFGRDVETWLETRKIDAVVIPYEVLSASGSRSGKEWKTFEFQHQGSRLLKQKEYDALKESLYRIDEQIDNHAEAASILSLGLWQRAKQWTCQSTHVACKGLIDLWSDDWIADVKTSREIEPRAWLRKAIQLRYHWQAATYLETEKHSTFLFVCIQNVAPYRVEVYEMERDLIERGRMEVLAYRRQYAELVSTRSGAAPWRSPTHGKVYTIPTPPWALRADEVIYDDAE